MNKRNYQRELDDLIKEIETEGQVPTLLLHSCCAPCSSYVLEYLSQYFKITVLYYNPNIYPESEYRYRAEEQKRFISLLPVKHPISFVEGDYIPKDFYQTVKGLEHIREGGERCFACYRLRLTEAADNDEAKRMLGITEKTETAEKPSVEIADDGSVTVKTEQAEEAEQ